MASLVFREPGNHHSELLEMRCSLCREIKSVKHFPASCAVYRRGTCRCCNTTKARNKCSNPLARKLESARVRYKRIGSVKIEDVALLYSQKGINFRNEEEVKQTVICKIRDSEPFHLENLTIKFHTSRSHTQQRPFHEVQPPL
jgi:hypothetical protein